MNATDDQLRFEDFPVGRFGSYGPRRVTREEIIAFAREFDPQPMHLDEEAAKASMLRGLAGSGWHVGALMMRMIFDGFIGRTASLGSPGVDEMKWMAPLRPDEDLIIDVDVVQARASKSRAQTGIVTFRITMRDSKQTIADMTSPILVRMREDA